MMQAGETFRTNRPIRRGWRAESPTGLRSRMVMGHTWNVGQSAGLQTGRLNAGGRYGGVPDAVRPPTRHSGTTEMSADTCDSTYDPCDREPRTFSELTVWMGYFNRFLNPRITGLRAPVLASNHDHHFLECFCKDTFSVFNLETLGRLRDRYLIQTDKTVHEIGATKLKEIADHFRDKTNSKPVEDVSQYVDLDQIAAMAGQAKDTLSRKKNAKDSTMPSPDIEGGGGNKDWWKWATILPWLRKKYPGRTFPDRFPTLTGY